MNPRIIEIIIDGYGYDPDIEIDILKSAFSALPARLKKKFQESIFPTAQEVIPDIRPELAFVLLFNRNWLNIYFQEDLIRETENVESDSLSAILKKKAGIRNEYPDACQDIQRLIMKIAKEKKYAVWAADTSFIDFLREKYPSSSTKTSGIEAGYEDLSPEVQGNSETGHQQLGNFAVAPQVPLEIAIDIENGRFYKNAVLNASIEEAKNKNANLNITFMASGEYGDDGRVHSCWNHLENFLTLLFEHRGFDPRKLRIEAILDGRDAPLKSSVEMKDQKFGFLYKLGKLMQSYGAVDSIAWIVGRGIAMDRDYEEERTRTDYMLLTDGDGVIAENYEDAIEIVKKFHAEKIYDPFVKPIAVKNRKGEIRKIEPNDVVVDLNFRADRQRARVAAFLGAKEFLEKEAGKKGKNWELNWLKNDLNLSVYCLTEYHPELMKYGAKIAYQIKPQTHNFLSIISAFFKKRSEPFRYLLVAESTKAVHMGYFIKGRREAVEYPECESRFIVPSYGEEYGIFTDDDYYKTPQMKAFEVAGKIMNEFALGQYDLAMANFSNPDMLGHLINEHFEEGVKSLEYVDQLVESIFRFAIKEGCCLILTSDHGNIDEFSSSHSLNQVISTFISPANNIEMKNMPGVSIKPFDIPWAITEILGISKAIMQEMPEIPGWIIQKGLVGKPPIKISV